jgi:hypothetical protein
MNATTEGEGIGFAVGAGPLLPSTVQGEKEFGFEGIGIMSGRLANNSGLLGFIWQPPLSHVFLDAGIRRGLSSGASDWRFTMGLTFSFRVPSSTGK